MFCLKIVQRFEGYKKCPFKKNFPDHGGIPYTLSVKLFVCSAKEQTKSEQIFLFALQKRIFCG